jgi:hypothetical protein
MTLSSSHFASIADTRFIYLLSADVLDRVAGWAPAPRELIRGETVAAQHPAGRLGRAAFRTTLRTVSAIPPVRRRMAAQLGQ